MPAGEGARHFVSLCKVMYRLLDTNAVHLLLQGGSIGLGKWLEPRY
jgi:hypothetical protein